MTERDRDSDPVDSDYLWDRSGPPDPEVQRLEALLAPLGHDAPLDELRLRRRSRVWVPVTAAAAVAIALGVALWWQGRQPGPSPDSPAGQSSGQWTGREIAREPGCPGAGPGATTWRVTSLAGAPQCGGRAMDSASRLPLDTWLETDARSRAEVAVSDIGVVEVKEDSRVRVLASRSDEHRLQLSRGSIHAVIDAPPRIFLVETPSALAVDLGCEYTLTVDEQGGSLLAVTFGYVSLERDGRASFVPEGARCETRPGVGPGTPYATTASQEFRQALTAFDFAAGGRAALDRVLELASADDTVTLWNLLSRVDSDERIRVHDLLAGFFPPPEGVTREAIGRADPDALLRWRESLEEVWLGDDFWAPDDDADDDSATDE